MMSRKDYQAFAEMIADARRLAPKEHHPSIGYIENMMLDYLGRDNPRFDVGRFLSVSRPSIDETPE